MKQHLLSVIALSLLAFCALPVAAQNTTVGAIFGTVTDPSGAVVPGVQITVTNVDTANAKATSTTDKGYYTVESLADGNYTI
jgi:hypothetical protein